MKKIIFIVVIVLLILAIFYPSYKAMQDKKKVVSEYETRIAVLEEANKYLTEEKRRLEEDPTYLEGVAREKMGLLKEGEVRYEFE